MHTYYSFCTYLVCFRASEHTIVKKKTETPCPDVTTDENMEFDKHIQTANNKSLAVLNRLVSFMHDCVGV